MYAQGGPPVEVSLPSWHWRRTFCSCRNTNKHVRSSIQESEPASMLPMLQGARGTLVTARGQAAPDMAMQCMAAMASMFMQSMQAPKGHGKGDAGNLSNLILHGRGTSQSPRGSEA
eukprot:7701171-Karenia_brevis.AAC.1